MEHPEALSGFMIIPSWKVFADIETKGSTFVDMVWLGLENALFEKSR